MFSGGLTRRRTTKQTFINTHTLNTVTHLRILAEHVTLLLTSMGSLG